MSWHATRGRHRRSSACHSPWTAVHTRRTRTRVHKKRVRRHHARAAPDWHRPRAAAFSHLAVVHALAVGEQLVVHANHLRNLVQHPGTGRGRRAAPPGGGGVRCVQRLLDICIGTARHLGVDLAGGGSDNVKVLALRCGQQSEAMDAGGENGGNVPGGTNLPPMKWS